MILIAARDGCRSRMPINQAMEKQAREGVSLAILRWILVRTAAYTEFELKILDREPEESRFMKRMIMGSMGAAGFVVLLAIADLALKIPFGGYSMGMDIMFLLAAGIVLYMGYDTYRDLT